MSPEAKTPRPRTPKPDSDVPDALRERVFEPGTHQYSDESGEYAVDPETGKVIRKL